MFEQVEHLIARRKLVGFIHTFGLLAVLVFLAARAASILFGATYGWVVVAISSIVGAWSYTRVRLALPPGSWQLTRLEAPLIVDSVAELARRAGLRRAPVVHIVPSRQPIALTTGIGERSVIVLSEALARTLPVRQLQAVLAHEVSHIRHNDLSLFAVVAGVQNVTRAIAGLAAFVGIVMLPLAVVGAFSVPLRAIVYLGLVPIVSLLAQMALLRAREFLADLGAVELTGRPQDLAAALGALGHTHLNRVGSYRGAPVGWRALFRTHPTTAERIERLNSITKKKESDWFVGAYRHV